MFLRKPLIIYLTVQRSVFGLLPALKRTESYTTRKAAPMEGLPLEDISQRLKSFAPLSLAEHWDNVGVLVEPSSKQPVKKVLLTIDLTENVLDEAIDNKASLILSYHPPIFKPLKRLTQSSWKERIIIRAIEHGIAIYSPHTAFDSLAGGVNDWLLSAYPDGTVSPIQAVEQHQISESSGCCKIVCTYKDEMSSMALNKVAAAASQKGIILKTVHEPKTLSVTLYCRPNVSQLHKVIKSLEVPSVFTSCELIQLGKVPLLDDGVGRIKVLESPMMVSEMIDRTKRHLGLERIRVSLGRKSTQDLVRSIAVCAGSGSSVLGGVTADAYITGEMGHHDLLDTASNGRIVLLGEHSNTERGYLHYVQPQLKSLLLNKVDIVVSNCDRDPVEIV